MSRHPLNPEYPHLSGSASATHHGANRSPGTGPANVNALPHAEELVALAKKISGSRHRRKEFLAAELFAEPAWEMLLALYCAHAAGHRMSVSNMCHASDGPDTTALRWIDKLEELGMVTRRKNPLDARMIFIEMAPDTRARIQDYLMETWVSFFTLR